MRFLTLISLLIVAGVLAGCDANAGSGDPVQAVEQYLQAKIDADADALGGLLCAEREADLEMEARTFETVADARLEDVACTFDSATNTVSCEGAIVATYGTEDTSFPLTTYRVVQEDGQWKWCGEA